MPTKPTPYLKQLSTVEDFEVWQVDGEYIRNNTDREFTNFGQHFRFKFIPTHEFWIDREASPDETDYFINHMIIEWHLMHKGDSYDYSLGKADEEELKERKRSKIMKEALHSVTSISTEIPKKLYKEVLKDLGEIKVWLVSGELVRDLYFIDFTEGGHHFVYGFVPYNEVWIDDDLVAHERPYVLLHELHERYLMSKGWSYNKAHHSSSIIEYKCRKNPELLTYYMKIEVDRNMMIESLV